ncbi:MAG TPA: hypothetical protein DCE41_29225 [Cytophagales bacterium]|nr:hypothetical protein [Cytophagales bacterium]
MRAILFPFFAVILLVSFGCNRNSELENNPGLLEFMVPTPTGGSPTGRPQEEILSELVVTVVDANGDRILDQEALPIVNFGGDQVTEPVSLTPGNYTVTELWITNEDGDIVYATPQAGSELAYLVDTPLPISLSITTDEVTQITPQLLSVEESTPQDFGYAFFSFEVVPTFNFLLGTFIYNSGFQLTEADLSITNTDGDYYSTSLEAATNSIKVGTEDGPFTLTISKSGYETYTQLFSVDSLLYHRTDPLEVILMESTGPDTLILQPDSALGKDAVIWSNFPDRNLGNSQDVQALNWTWRSGFGSGGGSRASLIDFDLSAIPEGATVTSATLFLSYNPTSAEIPFTGGHSSLTASNDYQLERVIEAWDEDAVTWANQPAATSTNSLQLSGPPSATADVALDVTALIQDSVDDPNNSYGLKLSLQGSAYYAAVIFASSDNANPGLHPKLIVTYE